VTPPDYAATVFDPRPARPFLRGLALTIPCAALALFLTATTFIDNAFAYRTLPGTSLLVFCNRFVLPGLAALLLLTYANLFALFLQRRILPPRYLLLHLLLALTPLLFALLTTDILNHPNE
jgi:hypothetical protein